MYPQSYDDHPLSREFSFDEFFDALAKQKNASAPGIDGFTTNHIKEAPDFILEQLFFILKTLLFLKPISTR